MSGFFNLITNSILGRDCKLEKDFEEMKGSEERMNSCYLNWVTLFSIGNKVDEEDLMTA